MLVLSFHILFFFVLFLLFGIQIRERMSFTLANMTMDDVKTVRETANSVAKLAAFPDQCTLQAQVSDLLMNLYSGTLRRMFQ